MDPCTLPDEAFLTAVRSAWLPVQPFRHWMQLPRDYQRDKVERLCRYIARHTIAEQRLSLTPSGKMRYELKAPFRNGTTHVIFEPLDFLAISWAQRLKRVFSIEELP